MVDTPDNNQDEDDEDDMIELDEEPEDDEQEEADAENKPLLLSQPKFKIVTSNQPVKTESPTPNPPSTPTKSPVPELHTKPWYVGCEFRCQLCSKMFLDVTKLLFHIKMKHGTTQEAYAKRFGKLSTKLKFYTCAVCKTKVKHQKSSIVKHLSREHQMKLEAYTEVFHPNQAIESSPEAPRSAPASSTSSVPSTAPGFGPTNSIFFCFVLS